MQQPTHPDGTIRTIAKIEVFDDSNPPTKIATHDYPFNTMPGTHGVLTMMPYDDMLWFGVEMLKHQRMVFSFDTRTGE